ncbi:Os07g0440501 [Oryza sativa Japonica Group]|uniref:Secreted protein n=2 Tax=Oryza sativa subsp. japonica TaxID=39947 RepID=A0A0P0X670_ORYSJ|nr:hypothetical protein [Oryza sativa Japonica Group]BAD31411.1 hypothetical protein [Oryza sativa Japonica Group]BAT01267.1 Os07g0440501 [Oryza sativa Japonica Group]
MIGAGSGREIRSCSCWLLLLIVCCLKTHDCCCYFSMINKHRDGITTTIVVMDGACLVMAHGRERRERRAVTGGVDGRCVRRREATNS